MRKARHLAISSRLEATKRHGLVEDYAIEWPISNFAAPRVKVRSRAQFPDQLTLNYVAALLGSLVPSGSIEVERVASPLQKPVRIGQTAEALGGS